MPVKSSGDDWFAVALSPKYGGLNFHYVDGPLNVSRVQSMVSPWITIFVYFGYLI